MLDVVGLSKRYEDIVALDGCTFSARSGRITGFVGPNGAGKTTTMRSVFGLVLPDAGEIHWRGGPIGPAERRRFGYLPEERGLYPKMKLREQIVHFGFVAGLSRADAGRSADRSLEWLDLTERADSAVDELSHGNQQRAQLAVALVHDPELLVLDEPFAGLDPVAVDDLGAKLRELATDGRTILFSSHQLDLVQDLCEDVVTLHSGRVVLAGELNRLRNEARNRHIHIEVAGARQDWFQASSGVEVIDRADGRIELLADRSVDLEAILAQAAAAGEVRRFEFEPPSLSQLFRDAVRQ